MNHKNWYCGSNPSKTEENVVTLKVLLIKSDFVNIKEHVQNITSHKKNIYVYNVFIYKVFYYIDYYIPTFVEYCWIYSLHIF